SPVCRALALRAVGQLRVSAGLAILLKLDAPIPQLLVKHQLATCRIKHQIRELDSPPGDPQKQQVIGQPTRLKRLGNALESQQPVSVATGNLYRTVPGAGLGGIGLAAGKAVTVARRGYRIEQ